jgi:hypothetical protein
MDAARRLSRTGIWSKSMAIVNDDQHIKKGLKFLAKANKHVIRASHPLEKLLGVAHPPGIHDLLKDYGFEVAGNSYSGLLTKRQAAYLNDHAGSLKKFAKAVTILLIVSNKNVVKALDDLGAALEAPLTQAEGTKSQDEFPAPTGCCMVDGEPYNYCTQTYCEQGLQGTWSNQPCGTSPRSKSSKAAGAK